MTGGKILRYAARKGDMKFKHPTKHYQTFKNFADDKIILRVEYSDGTTIERIQYKNGESELNVISDTEIYVDQATEEAWVVSKKRFD